MTLAKSTKTPPSARNHPAGGETHQTAEDLNAAKLTTNHGVPVSDNQNSLKSGSRGPTLLEDFVLREKIFHFDHERIPERIVHARGSGAHGVFEATDDISDLSMAAVFTKGEKTEVFVRFSTVAGGAGSVDTPRDVRGFAVKFYTREGNWDLVGNNIPVFFIQDALKFPDLVHAVKMEADRGYPQAGSAHDTFWDWASLMPETTHMLMWAMSDRTLPRSFRMMEGFGVHTFKLVNAKGEVKFVKFHWKPRLGLQSTIWDEALKLQAADNDYQRRDLFEAIDSGDFPQWDLGVQVFDQGFADAQPYDVLDATKLIPEEDVPVRVIGTMTLNRNVDNFFAETEQVAFLPSNIPPGIDFSNDPLLQGRLFSYLDTQNSRLGTTNFHQIPVNAPRCPFGNFQRDGKMQTMVPKGRANYEPNSLAAHGEDGGPRESVAGFATANAATGPDETGDKLRVRSETFADHYSQARLFYRSQTKAEQAHIASSFVFELSKVGLLDQVPGRMVANLRNVDEDLAQRVASGLGIDLPAKAPAAKEPVEMKPSDALSIHRNMKPTLEGRAVGILIADGTDAAELESVIGAVKKAKGKPVIVAPKVGGAKLSDGSVCKADGQLAGSAQPDLRRGCDRAV
jgi:Catalase